MGVADGVIMPTIITAHIAKTNANSVAFQGAVAGIIRAVPAGIILKPGHVHVAHVHIGGEPEHVSPGERGKHK